MRRLWAAVDAITHHILTLVVAPGRERSGLGTGSTTVRAAALRARLALLAIAALLVLGGCKTTVEGPDADGMCFESTSWFLVFHREGPKYRCAPPMSEAGLPGPSAPSGAGVPSSAPAPAATPEASWALSVLESPQPSTPATERFFYIGSDGGLAQGPARPPSFTINRSWHLVSMTTYHYINDTGVPAAGQIGLLGPGGAVYGPWQATGSDGQGGIPNAYWTATVDVVLPPGTYEVTDSDHATWSQNKETHGFGMAYGFGYPAP
jgi:hypothetical protein